jgi:hypothetical protein
MTEGERMHHAVRAGGIPQACLAAGMPTMNGAPRGNLLMRGDGAKAVMAARVVACMEVGLDARMYDFICLIPGLRNTPEEIYDQLVRPDYVAIWDIGVWQIDNVCRLFAKILRDRGRTDLHCVGDVDPLIVGSFKHTEYNP